MKRITILMVLVLSMTISFGQKNVRQTASNFLKSGKLDKALEAINECVANPATIEDARSWFIRGNIYLEIAHSKDETYAALDPDPLTKSLESYQKAIQLDPKKEFYEDIFVKLSWERNNLYNTAVDAYNKNDFSKAMQSFANAADVIEIAEIIDTVAYLNAAYCASLAKDYETAKKYYLKLLDFNYKTPALFVSISDIYRIEGDKENAMKYIQMGKEEFPNDPDVFLGETSVFLTFNLTDRALSNLLAYIDTDTTNYSVYFALGTIYDKIVNDTLTDDQARKEALEKAIKAYEKSLELNPEYFSALYNIGALYVNTAATIETKANSLPLDKVEEYEQMKVELTKYLEMAAPFLEQASTMQPDDVNTLQTLRLIYSRTGQNDKLREVNTKIDSLQ
ncbi:MAG: tetratricopeptide repeat protein [Bacteroidales bacterium]|nr:tetratricopeptide repeat protein [Bacteroidales bacterium]